MVRTIFAQPDPDQVWAQHRRITDHLHQVGLRDAAEHLDGAAAQILVFTGFPKTHWRQIWSNNPQERLNKEIRRRTNVVGIFPTLRTNHCPSSAINRSPKEVNAVDDSLQKLAAVAGPPSPTTGRAQLDTLGVPATVEMVPVPAATLRTTLFSESAKYRSPPGPKARPLESPISATVAEFGGRRLAPVPGVGATP